MAKSDSNRDRIGKMFELLAPPLDEFITLAVEPELDDGVVWTTLVAEKDGKKAVATKSYDRRDPQVQLRMLTENVAQRVKSGWRPFDGRLGPTQRAFASELRDARNDWAHMKSFSDDDAYRILDTAERFLNGIGSSDGAGDVRRLRLELRRVASDKDDRRALKSALVMPESDGLAPWRDVLQPHEDVATGNFQAAEFAADLYKVSVTSKDVGSDYADPVEFFSRTYLTEGLRDLIGRAVRRLSGDDNASPVINLQTNFGGGKTHSMLALWHLAAALPSAEYGQELQELLEESGYGELPKQVKRVALVGNHVSPAGSTKSDGTTVNTLWGELAWQLGGADAYALVAQSDQDRTPPGEALHTLIAAYSPAVILIDEWVAFARSLVSRSDLAAGSFDDQFTFAQSLTEAVKGQSGVLLAISIPASESGDDGQTIAAGNAEEVGGAHGLEALQRLQNVVRRVADQWRPASADESYHIVRQRLFVPVDAEALATISATARKFGELYRKNGDDFPREARDTNYEERIKRTYPIHPELFDRLYEDWSSLERFQRTRGVLRLMNTVIHALWIGGDQSPLIMPASVPLATAAVNAELTQYLQDSWKPIIDADVDGLNSEPAKIDKEKPLFGGRSVTKRLARTVFVGAAPTIGTAHKGLEAQRVFLGAAVPGDVVGNFHSALSQLADRGTYFYSGSGKYWYDLQANISRRAKDHADRIHKEEVWSEITKRLDGQAKSGAFAGVHVCPEENGDIPDFDEARLVVMHPRLTHRRENADSSARIFAMQAAEHRGSASRVNRNMVVFLAADEPRMDELDRAVRTYLGWSEVLAKQKELDLTDNQKAQAAEKRRQVSEVVESRLLGTYQWALVPDGQPVTLGVTKVEGQSTSLAERVSRRLENDGALSTQQAGAAIRHQLNDQAAALWKDGHVSVGDLWKTYAQYPYMPRLTNRPVLYAGLLQPPMLWEQDGFALADGYDSGAKRYVGLVLPSDEQPIQVTDQTLIVHPDVATAQRAAETPEAPSGGDADTDAAPVDPTDGGSAEPTGDGADSPLPSQKTRFFASKRLSSDRYAMDFKNVADEVLAHLASAPDATIRVTLEIEATAPGGFDESQVRVVSENAATLKFEQSGFEEQ